MPESHAPVSDVHVWETAVSSFVVVTSAPTPTRRGLGLNANALMLIAAFAAGGGGAVVVVVGGGDVVGGGGDGDGAGPAPAAGGAVSTVAGSVALDVEVGAGTVSAAEDTEATFVVVVAAVVVVVEAAVPLFALDAGRGTLLAALTVLWESPPQAPSPRAATTTSAVTYRTVGVPTAPIYG